MNSQNLIDRKYSDLLVPNHIYNYNHSAELPKFGAPETTGLIAKCVDPDQIVHLKSYMIWILTICLRINMHILRTSSNQHLFEIR